MSRMLEILITDLRYLLKDLGADGGLMSPSVYDTAQVARLAPSPAGAWPALEWLLTQQQPDGGWGDPALPYARAVPTLAAALALIAYGQRRAYREAAQQALACLYREAAIWSRSLPNDLPVGVELLFPRLIDEAAEAGIELPFELYRPLLALGSRRRQLIAQLTLMPGTSAVHSWEAFGTQPDPALFDAAGGIGHSPTATAAWLRAAAGDSELAGPRARAWAYLEQAARATQTGIPGVVPTAWPIDRFEHSFGNFALFLAGLNRLPAIADLVAANAANTLAALRPRGFSFSDAFETTGDDTATGVILLHLAGHKVDPALLRGYVRDGHYCTFPRELQTSYSALARATYAMSLLGESADAYVDDLLAVRSRDGRWSGDKWHGSWLYTTCHAIHALSRGGASALLAQTLKTLLAHQHADGGWGSLSGSNTIETAYGVLSLYGLARIDAFRPLVRDALARARTRLWASYRPFHTSATKCWIGKEIYRPYRVDRAFELSATLAVTLDPWLT